MTLAEEVRTKYGLTSLKIGGSYLPLMAINEALEAAARIADRNDVPEVAKEIRRLKWDAGNSAPAQVAQRTRDVA
jgi:hypothetical protein